MPMTDSSFQSSPGGGGNIRRPTSSLSIPLSSTTTSSAPDRALFSSPSSQSVSQLDHHFAPTKFMSLFTKSNHFLSSCMWLPPSISVTKMFMPVSKIQQMGRRRFHPRMSIVFLLFILFSCQNWSPNLEELGLFAHALESSSQSKNNPNLRHLSLPNYEISKPKKKAKQIISLENQSQGDSEQIENNRHKRKTMMLPPPPVTPFRGGLRTVQHDDSPETPKSKSSITFEADSSDRLHHEREALLSSSSSTSNTVTSWTPEEFPNPWINPLVCGGAATASMLNDQDRIQHQTTYPQQQTEEEKEFRHWFYIPATLGNNNGNSNSNNNNEPPQQDTVQPQQSQQLQPSRLMFCDPDQVLDKDMLRVVAEKLQTFSETFGYRDFSMETYEGDKINEAVGDDDENNGDNMPLPDETSEDNKLQNASFPASKDQTVGSNGVLTIAVSNIESVGNAIPAVSKTIEEGFEDLELHWSEDEGNVEDDNIRDTADSDGVADDSGKLRERVLSQLWYDSFAMKPIQSHSRFEQRLYSDSVGGVFSSIPPETGRRNEAVVEDPIEIAIALVKKINLPAILRADSYFFYSDQDDMVNDAAQYFARYIHDTWSRQLAQEQENAASPGQERPPPTNLVLIFISTQDKICYISSGSKIATVLPWWRLEHVVQDMKPDLRKGQTGEAMSIAIDDLTALLFEGPPTFLDRVNDFMQRFGIVMAFTMFTFVFATWGECRDRRKRLFFAIRRSRMSAAEKEKARLLQKEFKTKMCPICLEPFELGDSADIDKSKDSLEKDKSENKKPKRKMKRVDSFGIPTIGSDELPIKLLRCGHIFDESCWKAWVDSGHGNPWICPVCRQDVGRVKNHSITQQTRGGGAAMGRTGGRRDESAGAGEHRETYVPLTGSTPSMLLRPVSQSHPNYNSMQQSWARNNISTRWSEQLPASFAPMSHPTLHQLHPMFGVSPTNETVDENTPLFQTSNVSNEDDDDY